MVTHLQDHHCNEAALKAAAKRRKEGWWLQKFIYMVFYFLCDSFLNKWPTNEMKLSINIIWIVVWELSSFTVIFTTLFVVCRPWFAFRTSKSRKTTRNCAAPGIFKECSCWSNPKACLQLPSPWHHGMRILSSHHNNLCCSFFKVSSFFFVFNVELNWI